MVIRRKKVDEDWKNQAEKEKEKIAGDEEAKRRAAESAAAGADSGPPPDTASLIPIFEQLAGQAMAGLGQVPDPRTGGRNVDLDFARYAIELLQSLEAKTKGRLGEEEARVLDEIIRALESGFAQIEQQLAERMPPPGGEAPGGAPGGGMPGGF